MNTALYEFNHRKLFTFSRELRSLNEQLALAQSPAMAYRLKTTLVEYDQYHQSTVPTQPAKYTSTFLGRVLAFTPFFGYGSDFREAS